MTAIEDIRYLQKQGRLVLDMNTRAILELYEKADKIREDLEVFMALSDENFKRLDKALEIIKDRLDLEADTDETVHIPEGK